MNIADKPTSTAPRKTSALRYAQLSLIAVAGAAITLLVVGILMMVKRGTLAPLTTASMDEAIRLWDAQGIEDYNIEIRVTGRQASTYRVEVRDGDAQRAMRNGQPLGQRRTWATWTVPGMFGTLRADLRNMDRLAAGDKSVPRLTVQVQFDEHYGYPQRYVRVESIKMGANPEVTWEVIAFEVVARK